MPQTFDPTRRKLVATLSLAPALTLLPACNTVSPLLGGACSSPPADSDGVTWMPDVGHPVFFGVHDITPADGAPRPMLIYYPAADFRAPPVLTPCVGRFPLVMFLHGYPPSTIPQAGYYRRWWQIPSALARCGYVVAVPDLTYPPFYVPSDADVAAVMSDADWVRNHWSGAGSLDQRLTSTAVAGHSDGAMLSAAVAAAHPEIAALVSLGGPYSQQVVNEALPPRVACPSFFMTDNVGDSESIDTGTNSIWGRLKQPRYKAVYSGQHFDYLPATDSGTAPRGPCPHIGAVAADLVALFISANMSSLTQVPVDLSVPPIHRTPQQDTYAGGLFDSFDKINHYPGCRVSLQWRLNDLSGSRQIGL